MKFQIGRATGRAALAAGLAAGAWVVLSAFVPQMGLPQTVPAGQQPDRILVAQAETLVSYSAAQADRGEKRFKADCADCHGDDLRGGLLGGPPLRGLSFEEKYAEGSPAGVLFDVMSSTMPPNAPGRYSPSNYADLMAFILKRNGFQPGAELPSDVDALYELTMEK